MNDRLALDLIAKTMQWDDDDGIRHATDEYAWLRLMSEIKYDGYADFRAGVRFIETLVTWLKQFCPPDRQVAYEFIKRRLVYISPAELQRVIEAFVPEVVVPYIRQAVAKELSVKPYEVWSTKKSACAFERRLRKTLFVGMSDGSRIDILRRANSGRLSTEQVVPMLNVDDAKWRDLNAKLTRDLAPDTGDLAPDEKFEDVYLIDDLTASGTTFIRKNPDNGEWTGKLKRFNDLMQGARRELGDDFPIARGYSLHIHHYISSAQARSALCERLEDADAAWSERSYGCSIVTEGMLLPPETRLTRLKDGQMLDLCDRYYDHGLFLEREEHCRQANQQDMKRGYADCALPVILDHNTPNNSISLLWAETTGDDGRHPMRPLFRRRDRHA